MMERYRNRATQSRDIAAQPVYFTKSCREIGDHPEVRKHYRVLCIVGHGGQVVKQACPVA